MTPRKKVIITVEPAKNRDEVHSRKERSLLKRLAEYAFTKAGLTGEFTLRCTNQRTSGRTTLKGLSLDGVGNGNQNIIFGFQPGGNGSRYKYAMGIKGTKADDTYGRLKDVIGTALESVPKPKAKPKPAVKPAEKVTTEADSKEPAAVRNAPAPEEALVVASQPPQAVPEVTTQTPQEVSMAPAQQRVATVHSINGVQFDFSDGIIDDPSLMQVLESKLTESFNIFGSEFGGMYTVRMGDAVLIHNHPEPRIMWCPAQPGARGIGFVFKPHEDSQWKRYSVIPPSDVDAYELQQHLCPQPEPEMLHIAQHSVPDEAPMGLIGLYGKSQKAQMDFLLGMATEMRRQGQQVLRSNQLGEIFEQRVSSEYSRQALGQLWRTWKEIGLLRPVERRSGGYTHYAFGEEAHELLPAELKGLAPKRVDVREYAAAAPAPAATADSQTVVTTHAKGGFNIQEYCAGFSSEAKPKDFAQDMEVTREFLIKMSEYQTEHKLEAVSSKFLVPMFNDLLGTSFPGQTVRFAFKVWLDAGYLRVAVHTQNNLQYAITRKGRTFLTMSAPEPVVAKPAAARPSLPPLQLKGAEPRGHTVAELARKTGIAPPAPPRSQVAPEEKPSATYETVMERLQRKQQEVTAAMERLKTFEADQARMSEIDDQIAKLVEERNALVRKVPSQAELQKLMDSLEG